jgi:hypothetical protein
MKRKRESKPKFGLGISFSTLFFPDPLKSPNVKVGKSEPELGFGFGGRCREERFVGGGMMRRR